MLNYQENRDEVGEAVDPIITEVHATSVEQGVRFVDQMAAIVASQTEDVSRTTTENAASSSKDCSEKERTIASFVPF